MQHQFLLDMQFYFDLTLLLHLKLNASNLWLIDPQLLRKLQLFRSKALTPKYHVH